MLPARRAMGRATRGRSAAPREHRTISQGRQNRVFAPVHPGEIRSPPVIIAAQVQAAMHDVERQLGQPIAAARLCRAPGYVVADDDLPVDRLARWRASPAGRLGSPRLAQVERQHVGRAGPAEPLAVQPRHLRGADNADFDLAARDMLGAQRMARRPRQRPPNRRRRAVNVDDDPG
jgi:hypothetical protein